MNLRRGATALVAALCLGSVWSASIADFGGIPNDPSVSASRANSIALTKTFIAANASSSPAGRVAIIPAGADYYIFNVVVSNLYDVTFQIDGTILANNNISAWHLEKNRGGVIAISDSSDITVQGYGTIDGQGYDWWVYVFEGGKDERPHLVLMSNVVNLIIRDVRARNSPQMHWHLQDMANVHIYNTSVHVDVTKQKELMQRYGYFTTASNGVSLPIFPLNTDGFDPSGKNFLFEDIYVENFDDAVAVKPAHKNYINSPCSQNMTIRNSEVVWSVGLSIGSVPPNVNTNCVRDITFENIKMKNPLKALYVKTDPGDEGDGLIDNIVYRNIQVENALWQPIWIGPQQQHQPYKNGTGCSFLYPLVDECPTQPRVPVTNVKLYNVTMTGSLLMPGVVLCNETKPCTGIEFNDVTQNGLFLIQKDYVCKYADVLAPGSSPAPQCIH